MKKTKAPGETTLRVTEPAELMQFLLAKMGGMSRNSVKSLLSHRQVMVNGKVTTLFNTTLKAGDTVLVSSARGNIELTHPKLKIPELMRGLGKGVSEFKKGVKDVENEITKDPSEEK